MVGRVVAGPAMAEAEKVEREPAAVETCSAEEDAIALEQNADRIEGIGNACSDTKSKDVFAVVNPSGWLCFI